MKQFALAAMAMSSLLGAGEVHAATKSVASTAYYVSPNGSDSNNGLTVQTAFKTLEKARAGMVSKSGIKTTYLSGGAYPRTATLMLSQSDNGETWRNYPGQVPVVDGGSTVPVGVFLSGSSNVTIYGITFQNFAQSALQTHNTTSITLKDDTILNTQSTAWVQAGINAVGTFKNGVIQHNLVANSNYNGISIATDSTSSMSGTVISDNVVLNSCRVVSDCGAIYVEDPAERSSNVTITHNLVGNFGSRNNNTHGIYLDNLASDVKVTNNIVFGTGTLGLIIHGGHGNGITNNIFDISGQSNLGLYQQDGPDQMKGNVFKCNVVYSSAKPPVALWVNIGTVAAPSDSMNVYWSPNGAMPNLGIVDSEPVIANPQFANPASGDYSIVASLPAPACFTAIAMSTFGPEAGL